MTATPTEDASHSLLTRRQTAAHTVTAEEEQLLEDFKSNQELRLPAMLKRQARHPSCQPPPPRTPIVTGDHLWLHIVDCFEHMPDIPTPTQLRRVKVPLLAEMLQLDRELVEDGAKLVRFYCVRAQVKEKANRKAAVAVLKRAKPAKGKTVPMKRAKGKAVVSKRKIPRAENAVNARIPATSGQLPTPAHSRDLTGDSCQPFQKGTRFAYHWGDKIEAAGRWYAGTVTRASKTCGWYHAHFDDGYKCEVNMLTSNAQSWHLLDAGSLRPHTLVA